MSLNLAIPTLVAFFELDGYDKNFSLLSTFLGGVAGAAFSGGSQYYNTKIERIVGERAFLGYFLLNIAYLTVILSTTWGAQYFSDGLDFVNWNYMTHKAFEIGLGILTFLFLQGTWYASNLFKSRFNRAEVHRMYDGENIIDKKTHDLLLERAIIHGDTLQFWNSVLINSFGLVLNQVHSDAIYIPAFLIGSAGAVSAFNNWMKLHPEHHLTAKAEPISQFIMRLGFNKENTDRISKKMGLHMGEFVDMMNQMSADFILRLDSKLGNILTNGSSSNLGSADISSGVYPHFENIKKTDKIIYQDGNSKRPPPELKISENTCNMIFN